jgi:hypothetical protein
MNQLCHQWWAEQQHVGITSLKNRLCRQSLGRRCCGLHWKRTCLKTDSIKARLQPAEKRLFSSSLAAQTAASPPSRSHSSLNASS